MATTKRNSTVNPAAGTRAIAPKPSSRKAAHNHPRAIALAVATAFLPWFVPQAAHAQTPPPAPAPNTLPVLQVKQGGGQGTVHERQGNLLRIDQLTQRMILEGSFTVGADGIVRLVQPGRSAVALVNDTSGIGSRIFGKVIADGQLFVSNNYGVYIAPGAQVEAAAFLATTLKIADQDFMNGVYKGYREGTAGSVWNQGEIVTANGYTALIGPNVRNDGVIVARAGGIVLAAGDRVSLDMVGDGLISVSVDQAAFNASVINTGRIEADGGTVLLAARSANALLDTVINNSGTIRANSLVERNGQIILDGGDRGVVSVTGILQAAGLEAGTTGGKVTVIGENIGLFGHALVDVSGKAGGGDVRVGGGWQGGEGLAWADNVVLGRDATIRADALDRGDGGSVVLWAGQTTTSHGVISVRGGAEGGDGGKVETSGMTGLHVTRAPDLSAPKGKGGLWLLDPHNLTVVDNDGNGAGDYETNANVFTSTANAADIADEVIEAALNNGGAGGATVVLATGASGDTVESGTIDVQAQIDFSATAASTLVLRAHDDIILTAGVSATGASGLNLHLFANDNTNVGAGAAGGARSTDAVSGTGDVMVNAALSLNGGNFQSSGRDFSNSAAGTINTAGGSVNITHARNVAIQGVITAVAGAVAINGGQTTAGIITLNAAITGASVLVNGGANGDTFNINVTGATGVTLDGLDSGDSYVVTQSGIGAGGLSIADTGAVGIDSLTLSTAASGPETITVNATQVTRTGSQTITYAGGTGIETLTVSGSAAADTIDVTATAAAVAVTVDGLDSGDTYTVTQSALGAAGLTLSDTGASGSDTLTVNTAASGPETITVNATQVTRTGSQTITYAGGTGIETLTVSGSAAADTIDVTATAAAVAVTVDGLDSGDTYTVTQSALGAAGLTLSDTGASGSDTLTVNTAAAGSETISISGTTVTRTASGTVTYSGLESLAVNGSAAADTINVTANSIATTVDGLDSGDAYTVTQSALVAGLTVSDSGASGTDTFTVNTAAAGPETITVTGTTVTRTASGTVTYSGLESLAVNGSAAADTISVTATAVATATTVDGMGDSDTYTVTQSALDASGLTVSDSGGAGTDTLAVNTAAAGPETITVTGTTVVRTASGTVTYSGVESLAVNGSAAADTINVSSNSVTTTLDGLGAGDTYTVTQSALVAGLTVSDTGGAGTDTLTVNTAATGPETISISSTTVTRTASGTVTYSGLESLVVSGTAAGDTFNLNSTAVATNVLGGDGADMFNVNASVTASLSGEAASDTFAFVDGAVLSGTVSGGAGSDTLDLAAYAAATNTLLTASAADGYSGSVTGITTFDSIDVLTGGTATNTVTGLNGLATWTTTGVNNGTYASGSPTLMLSNFANWTGGSSADTFNLSHNMTGIVDGAAGTDTFNYNAGSIGTLTGGADNDTINGPAAGAAWTVTALNAGTVAGQAFSAMENLVGSAGVDTFLLSGGGTVSSIDGAGNIDTLTAANVANTWTITGLNSGTLTGTGGWSNIENLVGGTSTDSFSGVPGGSVGGTISDGGGGATTLSGTINSVGSQTYSAAVSSAGVALNAGTAAISAANAGNNFTGTLDVTGSSASITDMNALTIDANLTGGLITNSGALTYVAGMSVGSLNSTASGAVNQTGAITVTGATNINAGGNAITLTSANDFQGTLSLVGGTTQVRDANALTLGNVNVGAFTAITTGALNLGTLNAGSLTATTNGGNIIQSGPANVTGATSLQAGTGSITLALANDFGGVVAASGIGITLNDVNSLAPGAINAGSGSVSLSANSLGAGGTVRAGSASSFSSNTNVNGLDINMPNVPLALSGAATQWNFTSTPTSIPQPNPVTVPGGNVGVTYNLASIIASVAQQQAASASSSVSATVAAVIVDEANKTFGTDSVAEDVEYGFAGEVGATPPMDHRIDESGISLPRCVEESREGMPCK